MDKFFLNIYLNEISIQKNFALKSYDDFLCVLNSNKPPIECLYHIHHFLVHTSNIIKILFPKNNAKNPNNAFVQQRAQSIKGNLAIVDSDFDINEIGIRNDFEHYDTRIDFWVQNSKRHNYCDINIITDGAIGGIDIKDMFRNLDPQTKILTFCGKQYNLEYLKEFLIAKIKI